MTQSKLELRRSTSASNVSMASFASRTCRTMAAMCASGGGLGACWWMSVGGDVQVMEVALELVDHTFCGNATEAGAMGCDGNVGKANPLDGCN